jgi:hypothetical protein
LCGTTSINAAHTPAVQQFAVTRGAGTTTSITSSAGGKGTKPTNNIYNDTPVMSAVKTSTAAVELKSLSSSPIVSSSSGKTNLIFVVIQLTEQAAASSHIGSLWTSVVQQQPFYILISFADNFEIV